MARRKIYASTLIKKKDIYHLAKEFYKYIYRYPELEEIIGWKKIKNYAEEFLVYWHQKDESTTNISNNDYRDFLRFYTMLENKYYDEEREFIFTSKEKEYFLSIMQVFDGK